MRGLLLITLYFSLILTATAAPPSGYYSSADQTNAQTLKQSLHEIIDDHQRFPYTSTSTDTWDILESADEDPDNPSNVIDVYKNASYQKVGAVTPAITVSIAGRNLMVFLTMAAAIRHIPMLITYLSLTVATIRAAVTNLMLIVLQVVLRNRPILIMVAVVARVSQIDRRLL